jgi:hypothetical protein
VDVSVDKLPTILENTTHNQERNGVPPYFSTAAANRLTSKFQNRWVGRNGPVVAT